MQRGPTAAGSGDQLSRPQHALLSLCALSQLRRHHGKAPPGLINAIRSTADDQSEATGPPLKRQKVCFHSAGVHLCMFYILSAVHMMAA